MHATMATVVQNTGKYTTGLDVCPDDVRRAGLPWKQAERNLRLFAGDVITPPPIVAIYR